MKILKTVATLPSGWSFLTRRFLPAEFRVARSLCWKLLLFDGFTPDTLRIVRERGSIRIARQGTDIMPHNPEPHTRSANPVSLVQALVKHHLADEFRAVALPGVSDVVIRQWCRSRPELTGVVLPASMLYARKKLGCMGRQGGARDMTGAATGRKVFPAQWREVGA